MWSTKRHQSREWNLAKQQASHTGKWTFVCTCVFFGQFSVFDNLNERAPRQGMYSLCPHLSPFHIALHLFSFIHLWGDWPLKVSEFVIYLRSRVLKLDISTSYLLKPVSKLLTWVSLSVLGILTQKPIHCTNRLGRVYISQSCLSPEYMLTIKQNIALKFSQLT